MNIKIIAGGSGGNVIAVRSNDTIILVEAGLPKTKIGSLLIQNGFDPTLIQAIFISHVHKDHCDGVSLANKYRIPVYASEGSWKKKQSGVDYMDKVEEDLRNVITKRDSTNIECEFDITCFGTNHNDHESLGFVITEVGTNQRLSVCLDTGHVDNDMIEAMRGSDIYIIEANHDLDLLINGDYHDQLKARICSDLGHLSNAQTAEALAKLVIGKGERIILTHLSKSNNTPELAEKAVEDALELLGFERLFDYYLEVIR
jgi:phosphoribosyl 1,2-cyclic phosphodiesterase